MFYDFWVLGHLGGGSLVEMGCIQECYCDTFYV
jgi:hypothetical protein